MKKVLMLMGCFLLFAAAGCSADQTIFVDPKMLTDEEDFIVQIVCVDKVDMQFYEFQAPGALGMTAVFECYH